MKRALSGLLTLVMAVGCATVSPRKQAEYSYPDLSSYIPENEKITLVNVSYMDHNGDGYADLREIYIESKGEDSESETALVHRYDAEGMLNPYYAMFVRFTHRFVEENGAKKVFKKSFAEHDCGAKQINSLDELPLLEQYRPDGIIDYTLDPPEEEIKESGIQWFIVPHLTPEEQPKEKNIPESPAPKKRKPTGFEQIG